MSLSRQVALRKTMAELCEARDNAINLWSDGYRLLDQADAICRTCYQYGAMRMHDIDHPDTATKKIDAMFWRSSFERTGMTKIMDKKAVDDFRRTLDQDPPPFTMDNLQSQFLTMYQDADMMFRRGIYRVMAQLDYKYRTNANEPYQISCKNIVRCLFSYDSWCGLRLNYHYAAMVNDIDRVVKVMSGRPFHEHSLQSKINTAMKTGNVYEDEDFLIRGYKNGNGHWTFKDPKLVEQINLEIVKYTNHARLDKAA